MRDAERQILVRYQASLFTALAGVLVAQGLLFAPRHRTGLNVIMSAETEPTEKSLLEITISALIGAPHGAASDKTAPLPPSSRSVRG